MLREFSKVNKSTRSAISIFIGVLTLSYLLSVTRYLPVQNLLAGAYLLRVWLYLLFFLALKQSPKSLLLKGVTLYTVLTIIFSYIQFTFFPNISQLPSSLISLGWDPHEFRVFGTLLDVTPAGVILVLLFFWTLMKNSKLSFAIFPLILLSYSRITYIAFIFGLLFMLIKEIKIKQVTLILAAFLIVIPLLPRLPGESTRLERTFSIDSRLQDMKQGIFVWQKNALVGIGYNHIPEYKNGESLGEKNPNHGQTAYSSSFVTMLASAGAIGFGAFLYLGWKFYKSTSSLGQIVTSVLAVSSLFDNVFLMNFVLAVFLVLIALEDDF